MSQPSLHDKVFVASIRTCSCDSHSDLTLITEALEKAYESRNGLSQRFLITITKDLGDIYIGVRPAY